MSASVHGGIIADQLTKVLREAFEGPPGPWSYFTDRFPESGVFGTIGGLSAPDASRPAGARQATIAGHVQHLCFSLVISTWWIRGELTTRDRNAGWSISKVDETEWKELRATLHQGYQTLLVAIGTRAEWDEEALGGAIGAIAHVAYHLGAPPAAPVAQGCGRKNQECRRRVSRVKGGKTIVLRHVGSPKDISSGRLRAFEVLGVKVAVANVDGHFYAFEDTCPHTGCSLAMGTLAGTTVTCDCHGSQFDVTSGAILRGPARRPVRSWAVQVKGEDLMVDADT